MIFYGTKIRPATVLLWVRSCDFLLSQSLIFRGSDVMIAANFGLTKLHLVITEDITVPGGKIFSGFYNNGTLSYISVTNADGSAASVTVSFNAVAFGE